MRARTPSGVRSILSRWRTDAARYPLLRASSENQETEKRHIVLGRSIDGEAVRLAESVRLWHLHVSGPTGSGKSNFLQHLIRRDIEAGRGVLVIDPHGGETESLYAATLRWLDEHGFRKRRTIHLVDPNEQSFITGFNPLATAGAHASVVAAEVLTAFEAAWGGEDTRTKPTIRRVLRTAFTAAAELGLTLAEVPLLFDEDECGVRRFAVRAVENLYAQRNLAQLDALASERSKRDFRAEVRGPINRVEEFLAADAIVTMLGQQQRVLDFSRVLDRGEIVLANLQGKTAVHESEMRLLGALLVRALAFAMARRSHHTPYFVFIDECHRFLTGDIATLLAEARKMGVGLTLAHQFLAQLGSRGEATYEAVKNTARIKAVFGAASQREARELAEDLMTVAHEEPVEALTKPTVVGHEVVRLRGESDSVHDSEHTAASVSQSESTVTGESTSSAETASVAAFLSQLLPPSDGWLDTPEPLRETIGSASGTTSLVGQSHTSAHGVSAGTAYTTGSSRGSSHTASWSEALRPVLDNRPTSVHTVETQLYRAARSLMALPTGTGIIGCCGRARTVAVPLAAAAAARRGELEALRRAVLAESPSAAPVAHAVRAIAQRQATLFAAARAHMGEREPETFLDDMLPLIGEREVIRVGDAGITAIATIDTGASICTVLSTSVAEFTCRGSRWVRFSLLATCGATAVEAPVATRINIGSATDTQRGVPVVRLRARLGAIEDTLEFVIVTHECDNDILIGRPLLSGRFHVASGREFVLGAPRQ